MAFILVCISDATDGHINERRSLELYHTRLIGTILRAKTRDQTRDAIRGIIVSSSICARQASAALQQSFLVDNKVKLWNRRTVYPALHGYVWAEESPLQRFRGVHRKAHPDLL